MKGGGRCCCQDGRRRTSSSHHKFLGDMNARPCHNLAGARVDAASPTKERQGVDTAGVVMCRGRGMAKDGVPAMAGD